MKRFNGHNTKWALFLYMVIPLISAIIMEIAGNTDIHSLVIGGFVFEYFILFIVEIFLSCFELKICSIVILVFSYMVGMVEGYVIKFRDTPVQLGDVLAAKTALSVYEQYDYSFTNQMAISSVFLVCTIALIFVFRKKIYYRINIKQYIISCIVAVLFIVTIMNNDYKNLFGLSINIWDVLSSYTKNGMLSSFVVLAKEGRNIKPKGYSDVKLKKIIGEYLDEEAEAADLPNIIVIMNESFSDYEVLQDVTNDDYMKKWNDIDDYVMKGNVYVPVLGAGTSQSEFEFLTGCSSALFKGGLNAYVQINLDKSVSIPHILKEKGYNTTAFHPNKGSNWNRDKAYPVLGFDKFVTIADLQLVDGIPFTYGWAVSDEFNYYYVKEIFSDSEKPVFIFNVTMQNHGGYVSIDELGVDSVVDVKDEYKDVEGLQTYLTQIQESCSAYSNLLDQLRKMDEDTIVIMFGDHQPALGDNASNKLLKDLHAEQKSMHYITPYMIWANYDTGIEKTNMDMGISYLGAYLLKIAGIQDAYFKYLLDLNESLPVISVYGYKDALNVWHEPDEYNDKLTEYLNVEYYEIMHGYEK